MVLEGPSGIGKSTTIEKVIEELGFKSKCISLSARKTEDADIIAALPDLGKIGTVIVDDFHRLPDSVKERLVDLMKVLADSDSEDSKLILIGINKAGQQLVKYAHDLGLRMDVFKLESNADKKGGRANKSGRGGAKHRISGQKRNNRSI
jgi:replication-associated recombination protein RarA